MARGAAHVLEVVVLAGHAQALLRGGHARHVAHFFAQEELLELHHARVGEEQGGVVGRDQGPGGQDVMPVAGEEFQITATNLFGGEHRGSMLLPGRAIKNGRPRRAALHTKLVQIGHGGAAVVQILFAGGELLRMHAQEFRHLGFDLAAQFGILVQQGADLFAALAQLFGAEGEP